MIDYFALALGHGLLVLAFVRLFMRESLDVDPAIADLKDQAEALQPKHRQEKRASERQDPETPQDNAPQERSHTERKVSQTTARPANRTARATEGRRAR